MPRTEDGEFELVLGNKQLLSLLFIVIILFGVFFTMGYVMGRNSGPVAASTDRPPAITPAPRQDAPSAMPANTESAAPVSGPSESPVTPAEGAAAKPLQVESVAPQQGGFVVTQPQAGQMFVQVSSMLAQPEAELLIDVLGKKGFRAVIAPGPNDGKFRVLVGPLNDTSEASRTKSDVEAAGFKGAFVKKY
jgi:cell division septation protein DedD